MRAGLSLSACQETPLSPTDMPVEVVVIATAPDPTYAEPSSGVTFDVNGEVREYAFLASFDLILEADPDLAVGIVVTSDSLVIQQQLSVIPDGPGGGVDRERYTYESRSAGDRMEPGGRTSRDVRRLVHASAGGAGGLHPRDSELRRRLWRRLYADPPGVGAAVTTTERIGVGTRDARRRTEGEREEAVRSVSSPSIPVRRGFVKDHGLGRCRGVALAVCLAASAGIAQAQEVERFVKVFDGAGGPVTDLGRG